MNRRSKGSGLRQPQGVGQALGDWCYKTEDRHGNSEIRMEFFRRIENNLNV